MKQIISEYWLHTVFPPFSLPVAGERCHCLRFSHRMLSLVWSLILWTECFERPGPSPLEERSLLPGLFPKLRGMPLTTLAERSNNNWAANKQNEVIGNESQHWNLQQAAEVQHGSSLHWKKLRHTTVQYMKSLGSILHTALYLKTSFCRVCWNIHFRNSHKRVWINLI